MKNPFVNNYRGLYSSKIDEMCDKCDEAWEKKCRYVVNQNSIESMEKYVDLCEEFDRLYDEMAEEANAEFLEEQRNICR